MTTNFFIYYAQLKLQFFIASVDSAVDEPRRDPDENGAEDPRLERFRPPIISFLLSFPLLLRLNARFVDVFRLLHLKVNVISKLV